ncbi:hypothetical protein [Plectonema radiosum]
MFQSRERESLSFNADAVQRRKIWLNRMFQSRERESRSFQHYWESI